MGTAIRGAKLVQANPVRTGEDTTAAAVRADRCEAQPTARELRARAATLRHEYEALAGVKGKEGYRHSLCRKFCDLELAAIAMIEKGWW